MIGYRSQDVHDQDHCYAKVPLRRNGHVVGQNCQCCHKSSARSTKHNLVLLGLLSYNQSGFATRSTMLLPSIYVLPMSSTWSFPADRCCVKLRAQQAHVLTCDHAPGSQLDSCVASAAVLCAAGGRDEAPHSRHRRLVPGARPSYRCSQGHRWCHNIASPCDHEWSRVCDLDLHAQRIRWHCKESAAH